MGPELEILKISWLLVCGGAFPSWGGEGDIDLQITYIPEGAKCPGRSSEFGQHTLWAWRARLIVAWAEGESFTKSGLRRAVCV